MLVQLNSEWRSVTVNAVSVVQVRTDGEVLVLFGAAPSEDEQPLRVRHGWSHTFSALAPVTIWLRLGRGATAGEVYVGEWFA